MVVKTKTATKKAYATRRPAAAKKATKVTVKKALTTSAALQRKRVTAIEVTTVLPRAQDGRWSGPRLARELGLPVVESQRDQIVRVGVDDAAKGVAKSFYQCGFARACEHSVSGVLGSWVSTSTIYLIYPNKMVKYLMSGPASLGAKVNDLKVAMPEGDYLLKAIPESQKAGSASRKERGVNTTQRKKHDYKGMRKRPVLDVRRISHAA